MSIRKCSNFEKQHEGFFLFGHIIAAFFLSACCSIAPQSFYGGSQETTGQREMGSESYSYVRRSQQWDMHWFCCAPLRGMAVHCMSFTCHQTSQETHVGAFQPKFLWAEKADLGQMKDIMNSCEQDKAA